MKDFFKKLFVAVKPYLLPILYWLLCIVSFAISGGDDPNWLIAGGVFLGSCMNELLTVHFQALAKRDAE